jgi:hypothetical protein
MIDIPAETTISHYAIPARNLLMGCEASFFSAQPSNLDIARCSQHVSSAGYGRTTHCSEATPGNCVIFLPELHSAVFGGKFQ